MNPQFFDDGGHSAWSVIRETAPNTPEPHWCRTCLECATMQMSVNPSLPPAIPVPIDSTLNAEDDFKRGMITQARLPECLQIGA